MAPQLPDTPDEKELWRSQRSVINQLLFDDWDPIGVNAFDDALDEYKSYAGVVATMCREGATAEDIATYLTGIARNQMELSGFDHMGSAQVAEKIARIFDNQG